MNWRRQQQSEDYLRSVKVGYSERFFFRVQQSERYPVTKRLLCGLRQE